MLQDKTFALLAESLTQQYSPSRSSPASDAYLTLPLLYEGEGVDDIITQLRHLAGYYEFGTLLSNALLDTLVSGLGIQGTQRSLFAFEDLTVDDACKVACWSSWSSEPFLKILDMLAAVSVMPEGQYKKHVRHVIGNSTTEILRT